MQFKVPQFIEIEDKIIGPLSLKQALYIGGGAGLLFVLWFILSSLSAFIVAAIPIIIFCGLLAFYKVNGRPFVSFLGSFFKYLTKPKLYLWKKKGTNEKVYGSKK